MKLADWLRKTETSQSELARRCRCSPAAINMIVAGKRRPRGELCLAIIRATDNQVRLQDLVK